jgi:hypothetical protein
VDFGKEQSFERMTRSYIIYFKMRDRNPGFSEKLDGFRPMFSAESVHLQTRCCFLGLVDRVSPISESNTFLGKS